MTRQTGPQHTCQYTTGPHMSRQTGPQHTCQYTLLAHTCPDRLAHNTPASTHYWPTHVQTDWPTTHLPVHSPRQGQWGVGANHKEMSLFEETAKNKLLDTTVSTCCVLCIAWHWSVQLNIPTLTNSQLMPLPTSFTHLILLYSQTRYYFSLFTQSAGPSVQTTAQLSAPCCRPA